MHLKSCWNKNIYTFISALIKKWFIYPTLMAADILLYDAEIVPVGADKAREYATKKMDIVKEKVGLKI